MCLHLCPRSCWRNAARRAKYDAGDHGDDIFVVGAWHGTTLNFLIFGFQWRIITVHFMADTEIYSWQEDVRNLSPTSSYGRSILCFHFVAATVAFYSVTLHRR